MPTMLAYGIPEGAKKAKLRRFLERLQETAVGVKALDLALGHVFVFLPKDHVPEGLGEETVLIVSGLFLKSRQDKAIVQVLCHRLLIVVRRFFPDCFVEVYDELHLGYASTAYPNGLPDE